MNVQSIPIEQIYGDPDFNSRGIITRSDVQSIMQSIQDHGLQQPIVVQPFGEHPTYKWRAVMGHRRLKAVELLYKDTDDPKYSHIPANVTMEILDKNKALVLNLIENIERKSLTLTQEAKALKRFYDAGLNTKEIAKYIGQSAYWVQTRQSVLTLPPEIQNEIDAGHLSIAQINDLAKLPDVQAKYDEAKRILDANIEGRKYDVRSFKPKYRPTQLAQRTTGEAFRLQDIIRETLGNSLATEVIGWYAGVVSDVEIHQSIQRDAKKQLKEYEIPANLLTQGPSK